MRRIYLWLIFLFVGLQCTVAQTDFTFMLNKAGKLVALPQKAHIELNIPTYSYKTYTPTTTRMIDERLKAYEPSTPVKLDERPMDMQILSGAYKPFFNPYASMLKRTSPFAFDFMEVERAPINEHLTFLVTGSQTTWPGLGGVTAIHPSLSWQSGDWQIAGGGYAARYFTPFNLSPEHVVGLNLHASYQLTDWLKLNSWGQYANYLGKDAGNNPHILMNPFFYHNSVGGSLEFKLNDNFGVGTGIQYNYNPMRRKMERQLLLFPIFN
jgi:hypothetical protein